MFKYKRQRSSISFSDDVKEKHYTRNDSKLYELECDQAQLVRLLRSQATIYAKALAAVIEACKPGHRCKNLLCHFCTNAAKRCFKRQCERGCAAIIERARFQPFSQDGGRK